MPAPTPSTDGTLPVELIHAFDPSKMEAGESIVIDKHGNIYVSLLFTGEIRKFTPDGGMSTLAVLPLGPSDPNAGLAGFSVITGLAMDRFNNIYAMVNSTLPGNRGVWKVTPNGATSLYGELPSDAIGNGVAMDQHENIYVADSALGTVWRVRTGGGKAEPWLQDPLLAPNPAEPMHPGANGLKFWKNALIVTVSGQAHILRIPIQANGAAGKPEVICQGLGGDDFAIDIKGNLYITTDPFNTVVRVTPSGEKQVLATAANGLDGPAAAAFGTRDGDRDVLYITSTAFFSQDKKPALMKMRIGIPGAEA